VTQNKTKYQIIGLMSGTSLDGLDIADCRFELVDGSWNYEILNAETIPYTPEWHERLAGVENDTALGYVHTDIGYGHLLGRLTREFIGKYDLKPDFVASHGHTVFHQPERRITSQIGHGAAIAAGTGCPVVCDFRTLDVALGGQGAPLVPIGDRLLFPGYDYCLNLGGFANISAELQGSRIAFDVVPANIVLNSLAQKAGVSYDHNGDLARSGKIIPLLLDELNGLPYYSQPPPKSLGKEWVVKAIYPLLERSRGSLNDQLATFCEHIAHRIAAVTGQNRVNKLLITGGGALNGFLVERIGKHAIPSIVIPDINTINYKEALIFAFLGLLRWRGENNCLKSVTGAFCDNTGGAIYHFTRQ
jgi:anhydro-N-acetylmuramic acid kinase